MSKISEENKEICSRCNTAIILYKTPEVLEEWRKFCKDTGLQIVSEIESKLDVLDPIFLRIIKFEILPVMSMLL